LDGYTPSASDPAVHIEAVQKHFDSDVTIVNVDSGQANQKKKVIDCGNSVLPKIRTQS
jgi:hypothetical protein